MKVNLQSDSMMLNRTILVTFASIFCSIFIITVVTSVVIDPYIREVSLEENLLNFYEENNDTNKIYIIGDSLPQWGLDSLIIEDHLQNAENKINQSFNVYNLAIPGDNPVARLIELPYIAKSKPKIVVFCPQYYWFNENYSQDHIYLENRFALSANRIILDPYTKAFFNKIELDIIQKDYLHLITYKRMLLAPSLEAILSKLLPFLGVPPIESFLMSTSVGFKNPPFCSLGFAPHFKVDFVPPINADATIETIYKININKTSNNQDAFMHMINVLKSQGITVLIITMPYKSELLRSFSNESIVNYLNFINKTQCHHYDLISICSDAEFYNNNHLNYNGRLNLSSTVAELLQLEVINVTN